MSFQIALIASSDPALRFTLSSALDDAGIRSVFALSRRELYRHLGAGWPTVRDKGAVVVDARRAELNVEPLCWLAGRGVQNPLVVIADADDGLAPSLAEAAGACALFTTEDAPTQLVAAIQLGLRTQAFALALAAARRRKVHASAWRL